MAKILKGRPERDIKNIWNSKQRQSNAKRSGSIEGHVPRINGPTSLALCGGTIAFPPDFPLDPIERPDAFQTPLTLRLAEVEAAKTLSRGLVKDVRSRELYASLNDCLSVQLTTIQPNSPHDETIPFHSDDFEALDWLCEKWE